MPTPAAAPPYRIAIVGAGGVGGFFGARLAALPNVDVQFLVRAGLHCDALARDGLHVEADVVSSFHVPVTVRTAAEDIGPCDMVLVCVKAYSLQAVAHTLKPLLRSNPPTAVVPLLNGVGAPPVLAAALGDEYVLGGLCKVMAWMTAPGRIKQLGPVCDITFGELDGSCSNRAEQLSAVLTEAAITHNIPSAEEGGVHTAIWAKFAAICAFSGSGAVTRATWGEIVASPRTLSLHRQLLREGYEVATAHGAKGLDDAKLESMMKWMVTLPAAGTASLQRDLVAGRRSELHAQLGAMVDHADAKGISTPTTALVYAALVPQETAAAARALSPPSDAADGIELVSRVVLVGVAAAVFGAVGGALIASLIARRR